MANVTPSEDKVPVTVDPGDGPYTAPARSAAPTSDADNHQTMSLWSNKPTIELVNKQILRPYVPNNSQFRQPQIKFKLSVKTPSLQTTITVRKGSSTYSTDKIQSSAPSQPMPPSDKEFVWDGYSDANILDTEVFKSDSFSAAVQTWDGHSGETSQDLDLTMKPAISSWADVRVDLGAKKVAVKIYVSFSNATLRSVSAGAFDKVKDLIKRGIGKYWSRDILLATGRWAVTTTAVERDSDSVGIKVTRAGPDWVANLANGAGQRCFNPSAVVGGTPIIFFYNEALPSDPLDPNWNDDDDAMTGAHEFGHSVLRDAHDMNTSVTHKGTSSVSQQTLDSAPAYPTTGEIDLMVYCKNLPPGGGSRFPDRSGPPADLHARTIAAESDVRDLISVAGVEISS